jgi:dTDP-4-dehydrorhamnose reductase
VDELRKTRFCIIGGDGAIGGALAAKWRSQGVVTLTSTRRVPRDAENQFSLDLRDSTTISLPPCDVVILAAAMTRLSDCRADPKTAKEVNVTAPIRIARKAKASGAFVVFLSTNQVFDGSKADVGPDDKPNPASLYGKLKAEAETGLLEDIGDVAIVRLSKVVGRHLALFEQWRQDLAERRTIHAYADLMMAPIAMTKVLAGIEAVVHRRRGGISHLGGWQDLSYFEAADHLATRLAFDRNLVRRASAAADGVPAEERPRYASFARQDRSATGLDIPDARSELDIGLELQ